MKLQSIATCGIIFLLGVGFTACEDPDETFEPVNPNLITDAVVGTVQSTERTLAGAERQLSEVINDLVPPAEIASDNYDNTRTFFNQFLDDLVVDFTDQDIRELEFEIARLRELCTTGIDVIYPADEGATDDLLAGFYMLRGMSYLLAGETFKSLPATAGGAPVAGKDQYALAIADFDLAISTDAGSVYGQGALLARARANYQAGNRDAAVRDAQAAIDATPAYVYFAQFDNTNDGAADDNLMQDALFDRGTFDDLQPLPTLDFLDPKYNGSNPTVEVPIPVLKIEEAHLILAEAALSEDNLEEAKSIMMNIVDLVATRPVATFSDLAEGRTHLAPGSRPDSAAILVAPGPDRDFEAGLVLERDDPTVTVPTISGTSFDDDQIDAIGDVDFAYEALYRLRQEIFIAEGRRMTDIGVRFPVSQRESDANMNVTAEDNQAQVPSWLTGLSIDAFTYDPEAATATVINNVNRLISENRGSDLIAPFE